MQGMSIGMLRKLYYLPLNVAFDRDEKKNFQKKLF